MYRTNNLSADCDAWERDQVRMLERLPVCDECGEPIQDDHYYEIRGRRYCPDCLDYNFRYEVYT